MKKLLHHAAYLVAFQEQNEKARQELKSPAMDYYTSEELNMIFPLPFNISAGGGQRKPRTTSGRSSSRGTRPVTQATSEGGGGVDIV